MSKADARGLALIAALTLTAAGYLFRERASNVDRRPSMPAPATGAELPELVEIPAGPFRMGSDPVIDRYSYDNELWSQATGQGELELDVFYIARTEITIAQFRAFAASTGFRAHPGSLEGEPDRPVGSVSWPDALAYCRWLESALRRRPEARPEIAPLLNEGWRVSLPSEAEWEKAARGTDGRIFPWGNEPRRDRANYGGSTTTPSGSFPCPECPFGLADMSGNVWEMTRSFYRPYPFDPSSDDVDLDADALWVMRGGSYIDPERNVRTAIRGGADPGARRPFIGFRVVVTRNE